MALEEAGLLIVRREDARLLENAHVGFLTQRLNSRVDGEIDVQDGKVKEVLKQWVLLAGKAERSPEPVVDEVAAEDRVAVGQAKSQGELVRQLDFSDDDGDHDLPPRAVELVDDEVSNGVAILGRSEDHHGVLAVYGHHADLADERGGRRLIFGLPGLLPGKGDGSAVLAFTGGPAGGALGRSADLKSGQACLAPLDIDAGAGRGQQSVDLIGDGLRIGVLERNYQGKAGDNGPIEFLDDRVEEAEALFGLAHDQECVGIGVRFDSIDAADNVLDVGSLTAGAAGTAPAAEATPAFLPQQFLQHVTHFDRIGVLQ